jgi:hypothetical protein
MDRLLIFSNAEVRIDRHGGLALRALYVHDVVEQSDAVMVAEEVIRRAALLARGRAFGDQSLHGFPKVAQFSPDAIEFVPRLDQPGLLVDDPPFQRLNVGEA